MNLKISNKLEELDNLALFLEQFGEQNDINPGVIFEINLSLDELVTNTINYGFDDENDHIIELDINLELKTIYIKLQDDGVMFDPFNKPDPDLSLSLEEKPIGGLGIYFVKQKMDEWSYERNGSFNIIKLRKEIN